MLIWKSIHKDFTLPFPPCKHIIPLFSSKWNAMKHRSDTTAKVIDCRTLFLPTIGVQSPAIARLFLHGMFNVFKCMQLASVNEEKCEKTIAQVRNLAIHKFTCIKVVNMAINCLTQPFCLKKKEQKMSNNKKIRANCTIASTSKEPNVITQSQSLKRR